MRRDLVIGGVSAAALHAAILFGFHLGSQAVALPLGDTPDAVEVSLVAGPPDEPAAEPAAAAPAEEPPPPPDSTPPDPTPPPDPEPTPPPPGPVPTPAAPEPTPTPQPPRPPTREPAPKSHPHASVSARSHAESHADAPTGNPNPTGLATGLPGGAKGGKSRARYRTNPNPEYPAAARTQHQEGVVMLSVEVSAEGRPTNISLARSSGFPLLDEAAIAGVRRWTFEPARAMGLPVASTEQVPVRFRLDR